MDDGSICANCGATSSKEISSGLTDHGLPETSPLRSFSNMARGVAAKVGVRVEAPVDEPKSLPPMYRR